MEEYRQPWESDEHWNIRKEFLETYKDDFPENRLLCLAQVYSNIELLGCSYPEPVMRQVRELSKNLSGPQQLEENRKAKAIQFVKELQTSSNSCSSGSKRKSESIETSSKKTKYSHNNDLHSNNFSSSDEIKQKNSENSYSRKADEKNSINLNQNTTIKNNDIIVITGNNEREDTTTISQVVTSEEMDLICKSGNVVRKYITKQPPLEAIHSLHQKLNLEVRFDIELHPLSIENKQIFICKFYLKNILISSCTGISKKKAKLKTAKDVVDILMDPNKYFSVNNEVSKKEASKQILNNSSNSCSLQFSSLVNKNNNSSNTKNLVKPLNSKEDQDELKNSALLKFNKSLNNICIDNFLKALKHEFVIIDYSEYYPKTPISILMDSASFCHKVLNFTFEKIPHTSTTPNLIKCDVSLENKIIGRGAHVSKPEAKTLAANAALKNLQQILYTVKVKNIYAAGFIVQRNQVYNIAGSSNAVSDNNIGCKMLKMMGWKGGAIGKIGNSGILEPIGIENNHKLGSGLGYVNKKECNFHDFIKRLQALIQDYARSSTTSDLIFSKEFSNDERKEIHKIATWFHLKHVSHGKGNDRYITLSRKFTAKELIKHLLSPDSTNYKYELLYPARS